MATNSICKIEGCGKPVYGHGWCNIHWRRWRNHGDPTGGRPTVTPRGETHRHLQEVVFGYDGTECLIWPYWRADNGYGKVTYKGKRQYVHRLVCAQVNGPAPSNRHEAAHSCGNGNLGCINPAHLSWKTHAENEADKEGHGTRVHGERHGRSKLSVSNIREIRLMAEQFTNREISEHFNVSPQTIGKILRREKWAWLD